MKPRFGPIPRHGKFRSKTLQTRLTPAEARAARKLARAAGMTVSDYLRRLLSRELLRKAK